MKNFFLSLRLRISALIFVVLVVLVAFVILAARDNERAGLRIYHDFVDNRAVLLHESLQKTTDSLKTLVYDYTFWDEMVAFTNSPSEEAAGNLLSGTLETYKTDAIWIYNSAGELVYATSREESGINPYQLTGVDPSQIKQILTPLKPFVDFYARTDAGMIEIHGASIHPSSDEARSTPAQGYFFTGKVLSDDYLSQSATVIDGTVKLIYDQAAIKQQVTDFPPSSGQFGILLPLRGVEGDDIGALYANGYSEDIYQVFTSRDNLIKRGVVIFGVIVIGTYLAAFIWIIRPLRLIQKALRTGDDKYIAELKNNHDEFSSVAQLMSDSMGLLGKYQAIIESINDGLIVFNHHGVVERINQTALAILGYEEHELLGQKFVETVQAYRSDGQAIEAEQRPLSIALATRRPVSSSHIFLTKNGQKVDVQLNVSPIIIGSTLNGAITIFNDNTKEVTSRKAIENEVAEKTAELTQMKARLESSINSLNLGFIMTNEDDEMMLINTSAKKMLTGGNLKLDHWHFDDVNQALGTEINLRDATRKCMADWDPVSIKEVRFGDHVLRLFIGPVLAHQSDSKVEAIGCVIVLEDITESVVAARSRDEFFSIASHELRTPLTSIKGNSSMILEYYEKELQTPELHEMVEDIHESSARLISIVNDFLDVSKIEQGKLKYEITTLQLGPIIDSVLKELQSQATAKHIDLHRANDADILPVILGDRDRVKQIIYNLVGNAIKYTKQGSVTVNCEPEAGAVKISVSDSGEGIPEERKKLLFRKFQQAGDSIWTRESSKGTGLGLYISKLLVEGMGGNIWLEDSKVGKGSTFAFTLLIDNDLNHTLIEHKTAKNHAIDTATGLQDN
ncbi:MAG: ATP-binding protein [Candidatus Saccharibacteria bacterium]|nr:ATP-binding protein [Candidatus Saccharibacteria bacterium]